MKLIVVKTFDWSNIYYYYSKNITVKVELAIITNTEVNSLRKGAKSLHNCSFFKGLNRFYL